MSTFNGTMELPMRMGRPTPCCCARGRKRPTSLCGGFAYPAAWSGKQGADHFAGFFTAACQPNRCICASMSWQLKPRRDVSVPGAMCRNSPVLHCLLPDLAVGRHEWKDSGGFSRCSNSHRGVCAAGSRIVGLAEGHVSCCGRGYLLWRQDPQTCSKG